MCRHHIGEPKGTKGVREPVQFWLYVVCTVATLLGGAVAWGSSHLNAKTEAAQKDLQTKLDTKLTSPRICATARLTQRTRPRRMNYC